MWVRWIMGESYKIGDVAQLITGGTVYEGSSPQLSNVFNLSFGANTDRAITDLQRKAIAYRVGEVLSATGLERIDVYKVILTDFGINKLGELPRDSFHEVMALLDRWVKDPLKVPPSSSKHSHPYALIDGPGSSREPPPSDGAMGRNTTIVISNRHLFSAIGVAGALLCGVWLAGVGLSQDPTVCQFDGRAFSVGSVLKMEGLKRECQRTTDEGPEWAAPTSESA
jgi:hypothetical protein